ncbi:MAG: hypothetical protein R2776_00990 [Flavobacteriaceae bacterium]|nr:hypothetical protein [Flavobacteriaceae bacterium]
MKLLFSVFIIFLTINPPDLATLRENYPKALNNRKLTETMYKELSEVTVASDGVLIAYQGAITTLMAKFSKGTKEKKELFKKGVSLIEYAVGKAPENIEVRLVRLSVQENTPKFLKYQAQIDEDKQFIMDQYNQVASTSVKKYIKEYVIQSKVFLEEEKKLFK